MNDSIKKWQHLSTVNNNHCIDIRNKIVYGSKLQ